MTGETTEVRSDKRKQRDEKEEREKKEKREKNRCRGPLIAKNDNNTTN